MVQYSQAARRRIETIGFVPTMGALHEGHLSLIRKARKENARVVVSIFVNPAQFGKNEDFKRYPRNLRQDALLCQKEGVDILFSPLAKEMYPVNYKTYVQVKDLSDCLCGKFRPGHFKGVATVVIKLFNIVAPDTAYFGQKDAQQAVIIRKMAEDLNLSVKIIVLPTLRDKDGLAMSSRNIYLNKNERKHALSLYKSLHSARGLIQKGERSPERVIRAIRKMIAIDKAPRIDYISIVDPDTLMPLDKITNNSLIILAVWIGKTRLIDNVIVRKL